VTHLAEAEHFVGAPGWTWYILFYFFLAGLSGGSYVIATLLRLSRNPSDRLAARVGYYVAFPTLLVCPILLTLDLKRPLRFWHMLVNTTPGDLAPIFKYWSPMSVGAWALTLFGIFVTVSFVETLARDGVIHTAITDRAVRSLGGVGTAWSILGALVGLFIAGYTGVLLAVSNQPVWSDTWALGGLFLASGLTGSAALIGWLARFRPDIRDSDSVFARGERIFAILELGLIVVFVLTLIAPGELGRAFGFPWALLWLVACAGVIVGLGGRITTRRRTTTATEGTGGAVAVESTGAVALMALLVLIGVLALRAAVIFSAQ
jgi:formate-dependent nitrite reductase membrane component NrfD